MGKIKHRQLIEDDKFKSLMPPLSQSELEQLEQNILEHGIRDSLVIWDGIILDGHNRYAIAQKHGLDFGVEAIGLPSRDAALLWIVKNQLGRRNLTPQQISYLRGKQYEQEKKQPHAPSGKRVEKGTEVVPFSKTADKVAAEHKVSRQTVHNDAQYAHAVDTLADIAGDDVRASILQHDTPVTRQSVKQIAKDVKDKPKKEATQHIMSVMSSSASPEWYTPRHIIDLTLELFGGVIDTDPCSNNKDSPNVPAELLYTKDDDGLAQVWRGRIYMNPPYGREIPQWTEALVSKYESGEIDEAIALVPGRIDTRWFQPLYEFLLCHIRGRLNYPQSSSATPFPSIIIYLGKNRDAFVRIFKQLGPILERIE